MVRFPFVRSEWEVFACSEVAAITTAGRLAAAATPALPIRIRRRDGEGGAVGAIAEMSSFVSVMVDIVDLLTNKTVRRRSGADISFRQRWAGGQDQRTLVEHPQ